MKLTDLRDELTARADSVEDLAPDLLPGVRRKISQTKRRRTAAVSGFVGCVAVIAALVTGVIPGLAKTTPQPAEDIPTDYVKNGITFHGAEGADRLLKAWVGEPGENTLEFT
jgi:predicted dinucleotide-utilizing enzyme